MPGEPVFLRFLYRLRSLKVPVGTQEALSVAEALLHGVHDNTLDGFYHTARCLMIHHEGHLDAFDQAFLAEFRGKEIAVEAISDELLDWLSDALDRPDLDESLLRDDTVEEILRKFAERLAEQTERHDGGNHWIGTGGTSQFGNNGMPQPGVRVGGEGGGRSAIKVADARQYAPYRSDVTLDIRQMELALRRLRSFIREGAHLELDIDRTIDETARNAGEIEIVTRPPARPDTHVLLLIDVGGSMFPYSALMSRLFSATKKATHFRDLQTYYFHNCVYGKLYETDRFTDPVWLQDVLRRCDSRYKLIMVGDALMAPYELHGQAGPMNESDRRGDSGFGYLHILHQHYPQSVWLNPEPESRWPGTTIEDVASIFDMYPLTMQGLSEAMTRLNRGVRHHL
ncbi:MAG: VWA domain-containing protein [Actinobacteria bacterium]|nr:VWA domain-containing protein [Actinomycetota bacterium]